MIRQGKVVLKLDSEAMFQAIKKKRNPVGNTRVSGELCILV